MRSSEPAPSAASAMLAATSMTCSQVSSTSSNRRPASPCATLFTEASPLSSSPTAVATAAGTSLGSASGENCASHTPSAKCGRNSRASCDGQPRLANAPGPSQRDKPMRAHQVDDLSELVIPADQLRNRLRHISWRKRSRRCLARTEAGALIVPVRPSLYLTNELVAASRDRADQIAVRPQGGSQRRDMGLQVVFLYDPAGPYPPHQRVLGDYGTTRLDQRHQDIECRAAELNRLAVSNHFAAMRQHPEPPEPNARR